MPSSPTSRWGLLFLLRAEAQRQLIRRVGDTLNQSGHFLFTAPSQACAWADLSTGRESISLGAATYVALLEDAGLILVREYEDEGDNHYYNAVKP